MYKYRETTKYTNCDDCFSLSRFRFRTWTISGRLILLDSVYILAIPVNVSSPTMFSTEPRLDSHISTVVPRCILSKPCIGEAGVSRIELWKYDLSRCFAFQMGHWLKMKRLRTYDCIHSVRIFSCRAYAPSVVPCTLETPYVIWHIRPLYDWDTF
jgi:hypothetical protein